ncbi:nitroreductase family protein [Mycolicibacterium sp. XJ1819]
MADLFAVINAQRACRRFDPDEKVPDSDVEQILSAAVHAPSAENTQPWYFVVVRDAHARRDLAAWWTETWQAGGAEYARQVASGPMYADLEHAVGTGGFAAAPVVVVVCVDTEKVLDVFAQSSIYPAVQNLLLAANALGYGSCLTTGLTTFGVERVRDRLGLPEKVNPMAAVYIGKPPTELKPPRRRPFSEVTYRETFGSSW